MGHALKVGDWIDYSEQPPPWWQRPHEWPTFWELGAWRRWEDAAKAWAAEHGTTLWDLHNPLWLTHHHTGTSCGPRCASREAVNYP